MTAPLIHLALELCLEKLHSRTLHYPVKASGQLSQTWYFAVTFNIQPILSKSVIFPLVPSEATWKNQEENLRCQPQPSFWDAHRHTAEGQKPASGNLPGWLTPVLPERLPPALLSQITILHWALGRWSLTALHSQAVNHVCMQPRYLHCSPHSQWVPSGCAPHWSLKGPKLWNVALVGQGWFFTWFKHWRLSQDHIRMKRASMSLPD